jgi:uncharacterized membrane protein YcaP (DUF421 family)
MRLRTEKISEISMVKVATIELSGKLGIELFPEHLSSTKKDIEELKETISLIARKLNVDTVNRNKIPQSPNSNLFVQADHIQEQDPLQ